MIRISKKTGIVRKIDELGRIVIPKYIIRQLEFVENDRLQIFIKENNVIIKKIEKEDTIGNVRILDTLGRIVIPKDIRKDKGWKERTPVELYLDSNFIILKRYIENCVFCNNDSHLIEFKGNKVCEKCISTLKSLI